MRPLQNLSLCESATFPPTQPKMLDLGVEKFFHGANSGRGLAEVRNTRSSNGKCEFPSLTSGRTFGLILVIGVVIGMVAGQLGTLLTANLQSKVSENCLQSSKSLWVCVASLGAHWVPEVLFDPARTTISLLTAAVVVTEFLWSKSTVQISKDISPLDASFCVIYLFTLGWFVLTHWEETHCWE